MANPILKYFEYAHLPSHLQPVSLKLYNVAHQMDQWLPDCAEKSAGLRKLLEAKDCFVRARLEDPVDEPPKD
jgi:hypothetical protein